MNPEQAYQWLATHNRETALLGSVKRVLAWDQRTYIPPKGHEHRANQLALLARLIHERETDPQVGEHLARAEGSSLVDDPTSTEAVNLREWRRIYDRATRIPPDLAVALAKAAAEGQTAWEKARPQNDWPGFRPFLERLDHSDLSRLKAIDCSETVAARVPRALARRYRGLSTSPPGCPYCLANDRTFCTIAARSHIGMLNTLSAPQSLPTLMT